MARLPRLIVPHQPHHVIQTGANNQMSSSTPKITNLPRLAAHRRQNLQGGHPCYVLMPNHLHLLATPSDETGLGQMMQWIGRYYVPYFNQNIPARELCGTDATKLR
jgi:putative transposase